MRLSVTIFLFALVGSLYANEAVFQELAQINKHPFGAAVLAAVSTNLRVKTPVSDVADLLQKILDDIQADAAAAETTYNNRHDSLTTSITNYNDALNTLTATLGGLASKIQGEEADRTAKSALLDSVGQSITNTNNAISQLGAQYDQTVGNFDQDLSDLDAAIAACQAAIAKWATYTPALPTSAFIQLSSSAKSELRQFSATLGDMKDKLTKHGTMYAPLIHELIALTDNPEGDKASQIGTLLNQLLGLLQAARAEIASNRSSYIAGYNTQIGQLQSSLESYKAQQSQLTEDLAALNTQIPLDYAAQSLNQGVFDSTTTLRDQAQAALNQLETDRQVEVTRYDNLIAIMQKIIKHFNDNIVAVDDWTASQINGF